MRKWSTTVFTINGYPKRNDHECFSSYQLAGHLTETMTCNILLCRMDVTPTSEILTVH